MSDRFSPKVICKLILGRSRYSNTLDLSEWQADLARRRPVCHLVPAHVVTGELHHAERPEGARSLRVGEDN